MSQRDISDLTQRMYPTTVQRFGSHLERVEHTAMDGVFGEQQFQCVRYDELPDTVLRASDSGLEGRGCHVEGVCSYTRLATHPQHHRVKGRIVHQLHSQQLVAVLAPAKQSHMRSETAAGVPRPVAREFLTKCEQTAHQCFNIDNG